MTRKLRLFITLLLSSFLFYGCRSSKDVSAGHNASVPSDALTQFTAITDSYHDWQQLSVPVTMQLNKPSSLKISGTITMERDKYIHFSARFLGMEVASVMITPDSIFAKEKLHKYYVAESVSQLTGGIPVSLSELQQMMYGHIFFIGQPDLKKAAKRCSFESFAGFWTVSDVIPSTAQTYTFTINSESMQLSMLSAEIQNRFPVTVTYGDFTQSTPGPVASTLMLSAATEKKEFKAGIDFNYAKSKWSGVTSKSWDSPRGYNRISLSQLIKSLSNL